MKAIICIWLILSALNAQAKILTKKYVVDQVTKHFPELIIQQEKIVQANSKILSSRGVFDPSIGGRINSVPISGYENNYFEGSLNYPIENTGNSIYGGYRLGRGSWPIYYQEYLTNAYGDTFVGVNLPLIRNRSIDQARQDIWTNELLTESEKLLLTIKRNELIAEAINVYYEWLRANYRVKIASKLLSIAIIRQKAIDKQALLGDIAKINQVENRRLIMQRRSVQASELNKLRNAFNKLRFYLGEKPFKTNSNKWKVPSISWQLSKFANTDSVYKNIINFQPYLNYIKNKISQSKLAIQQAKNEMKPGLDLTIYLDKQHGQGNPRLNETSLNFGLKYQLPLRLRKARGMIAQNQSLIREYNAHRTLFIRKTTLTYREIFANLKALADIFYLRRKEEKYAEQLEVAERKRFDAGDSSLFLVNQRENTVASTRLFVIDALINYKQSVNLLRSICFYRKECLKK